MLNLIGFILRLFIIEIAVLLRNNGLIYVYLIGKKLLESRAINLPLTKMTKKSRIEIYFNIFIICFDNTF